MTGPAAAGTPYPDSARHDVLWIGGSKPPALELACRGRGLSLWSASRLDVRTAAPAARALVLELPWADPELAAWGPRVIAEALAHGLVVALVMQDPEGSQLELPAVAGFERDQQHHLRYGDLVRLIAPDNDPRVRARYQKWEEVAQWAASHMPGPGENAGFSVLGFRPAAPEAQLLLRRALGDLCEVHLKVYSDGKSGATVCAVTPTARTRDGWAQPLIVKIDSIAAIRTEKSNYGSVRDAIRFHFHAQLHRERCVEGAELGISVYDMVDGAAPLRDAFPSGDPVALARSVFERTLACWQRQARPVVRPIIPDFQKERLKALRWTAALDEASDAARRPGKSLSSVPDLRARIDALPAMTYKTGIVHGDLHPGNLFVRSGTADVVVIDYGSVQQDAPVVADMACLEVGLAFPMSAPAVVCECEPVLGAASSEPADHAELYGAGLARGWFKASYRYPITAADVAPSAAVTWLAPAVQAIRSAAQAQEMDCLPYAVAIMCYLLRAASFDDRPLPDRALAYELACGLLGQCEAEVTRRSGQTAASAGAASAPWGTTRDLPLPGVSSTANEPMGEPRSV